MRLLGLVFFALLMLALEGAVLAVFHLEFLRPDPVLILAVFIALKSDTIHGSITVFLSGLLADSFAGLDPGVLTGAYLLVWTLVRLAKTFLMPQQRAVQLLLVFVFSLVMTAYVQLLWPSLGLKQGGVWQIGLWGLLLALVNTLLSAPIWSLAKRISAESIGGQRDSFMGSR